MIHLSTIATDRRLQLPRNATFFACVVLTSALSLGIPQQASAEVIYSNLGPNDSFAVLGMGFGSQFNPTSVGTVLQPLDNAYRLESIEIPVGRFGQGPDETSPATIRLHELVDGLPGPILATSEVRMGFQSIADGVLLTEFPFVSQPELEQGTAYAFTASNPAETTLTWPGNNQDITGTNFISSDLTNGMWTISEPAPGAPATGQLAYRVNGTLVPEPNTASLIVLAGLGFLPLRPRKRSRRITARMTEVKQ